MNGYFWVHGKISPYFAYSLMVAILREQTFLLYCEKLQRLSMIVTLQSQVPTFNRALHGFLINLAPTAQFLR